MRKFRIEYSNKIDKYFIEWIILHPSSGYPIQYHLTGIEMRNGYNMDENELRKYIKKYHGVFNQDWADQHLSFIYSIYFNNKIDAQNFLNNVVIPYEMAFGINK